MIPFPGQSNEMMECAPVFSRRRLPFRSPDYKPYARKVNDVLRRCAARFDNYTTDD
jgi:hypothetical protein